MISAHCAEKGITVELYQSNHEGDLVDKIQKAYGDADGIVINPGAYNAYQLALLDAVKSVSLPTVEVHISDPRHARGVQTYKLYPPRMRAYGMRQRHRRIS